MTSALTHRKETERGAAHLVGIAGLEAIAWRSNIRKEKRAAALVLIIMNISKARQNAICTVFLAPDLPRTMQKSWEPAIKTACQVVGFLLKETAATGILKWTVGAGQMDPMSSAALKSAPQMTCAQRVDPTA
jgi:hypothetical protein